jgi:hypothetical protein
LTVLLACRGIRSLGGMALPVDEWLSNDGSVILARATDAGDDDADEDKKDANPDTAECA